MGTPKEHTAVRRDQIAQAVLDLIAGEGPAGVSVAALGERIGLVPSAVYRHFRSKDQVLDAVVELIHRRLMENVQHALRSSDNALERLRLLLDRHLGLVRQNQGVPRIVFSEAFCGKSPQRRHALLDCVRSYLGEIASIVRHGQQAGTLDPRVDPDAAAMMFLGLVQPPAMLQRLSGGQLDPAAVLANSWPLFCKALAPGDHPCASGACLTERSAQ